MPTKIEWADESWNVVTGCSKISEGCRHCYAERMANRLAGRYGYPEKPNQFKPTFHIDKLEDPLSWRKLRWVFVCSMGDLFHDEVPFEWVARVFSQIVGSKHTFLMLTKRPERMKTFFDGCGEWEGWITHNGNRLKGWGGDGIMVGNSREWPLTNLLLGVTVESDRHYDRIETLKSIPAAKHFVSFEPLLSSIDPIESGCVSWGPCGGGGESGPIEYDGCANIDLAIVGAETGTGKRPMELAWARHIRDWCGAFGISFFFKKDSAGNHELDGRVWEELPK